MIRLPVQKIIYEQMPEWMQEFYFPIPYGLNG